MTSSSCSTRRNAKLVAAFGLATAGCSSAFVASTVSGASALRVVPVAGSAEAIPASSNCSAGTFACAAVAGVTTAASVAARRKRRTDAARSQRVAANISADSMTDVCEQTGVTLNRYMIEAQRQGLIDSDVQSIFNSIREATKVIAKLVNRAPLMQADLLGYQGAVNVQGEDQKKLDVITNDVLKKALKYTGKLGTMASEEEDAPVSAKDGKVADAVRGEEVLVDTGKYVCVFDPLDGSSNVDAGIAVGTIFGIFKEADAEACNLPDEMTGNLDETQVNCLASTLQPGKALVAAGYVLYSCSTEMVFTLGRGCVGFTLDSTIGEFILTRPSMKIPDRGKIYSLNEANSGNWDKPMQQYIADIQAGKGESKQKYSLRYIGSMVGDVHRTLLYGGLFAYPADKKNPNGKLRLLYEAAPMSFLVEQAGGASTTGFGRVMDIPPVAVHQRVPIILGSKLDVEECQKYYARESDPALKERCMNRLQGLAGTKA